MQASHAPVVDLDLRSFAKNDTAILGSIKITLSPAETLALVGPSGIGKTSLLRIIAGIETGFEGDRRVHGKIAMVFQEPTLLPWRCLRDNITIPTGVDAKTAEDALTEVGLAGRGSDFPAHLLLDEPFVSLDPALADEMILLFIRLREAHQVASIFVTHVVDEAEKMASRTIRLAGSPARLVL